MPIRASIPVIQSPSLKFLMDNHILPDMVSVSEEWQGNQMNELPLCESIDWVENDVCVVCMVVHTDDGRFVRGANDSVSEKLTVLWISEIQKIDWSG